VKLLATTLATLRSTGVLSGAEVLWHQWLSDGSCMWNYVALVTHGKMSKFDNIKCLYDANHGFGRQDTYDKVTNWNWLNKEYKKYNIGLLISDVIHFCKLPRSKKSQRTNYISQVTNIYCYLFDTSQ